mgnify:CR=1 FL=1
MNLSQLAARRAAAIERIVAASDLDLSLTGLPRMPDTAHREMHILENIADHLEAQQAGGAPDMAAVLQAIEGVSGVGPALLEKIKDALDGYPGVVH